jgi:hypothetical protein
MRRGVIRFMKTTIAPICLVLSLALGFSTPAVADHGRHGSYRGGHYGGHYAAQPYHHHPGHYRQDRWVAPAAVLALTGIVAGVAAATYYSPPPVYVAPPRSMWRRHPARFMSSRRSRFTRLRQAGIGAIEQRQRDSRSGG